MAAKKSVKKKPLLATLVTEERAPCVFCQQKVDDEIYFGKLYAIGDIQCHYFCALLSCCLIQKGRDEEGLFGFLYPDIIAEVDRSKKHRCSYCGKGGASLGCSVQHCRKQFHLPCGRKHSAVSLFYGNYKSFCVDHAPKQKIPEHIMGPARERQKKAKALALKGTKNRVIHEATDPDVGSESVCVICYEAVSPYPTVHTFWPPCCARDAWFHRECVQRMSLSAGMHYLKCPLCNDKEHFYDAVVEQGYYVPDRDAAWELEQNAFAEIYERPLACSAVTCLCPNGRNHDADIGPWDIKLCILCGTLGVHASCMTADVRGRFVCDSCRPHAPEDIDSLIQTIESEIALEQARRAMESVPRGPLMPSRMSLRRTKPKRAILPSTSHHKRTKGESSSHTTSSSRLELNLKSPRTLRNTSQKPSDNDSPNLGVNAMVHIDNSLYSPLKVIEQGFDEKIRCMSVTEMPSKVDSNKVLERVREKLSKPQPLSVKKRAVKAILDGLFDSVLKENKTKDPIKEWNSPKKCYESPKKTADIENKSPTENVPSETNLPITPKKEKLTPQKTIKEPVNTILEDLDDDCFEKEADFVVKIKTKGCNKTPQKCKEIPSKIVKDDAKTVDDSENKMVESQTNMADGPKNETSRDRRISKRLQEIPWKIAADDAKTVDDSENKMAESQIIIADDGMNETNRIRRSPKEREEIPSKIAADDVKTVDDSENKMAESQTIIADRAKNETSRDRRISKRPEEILSKIADDDIKTVHDSENKMAETQTIIADDESSSSTFQLPLEFIAENLSDNSIPFIETPKKCKTVHIEKDSSLEISENNATVNIDVIKIKESDNKEFLNRLDITPKTEKCSLKFSPKNKDNLEENKVDMDLESFKKQYLNEVGTLKRKVTDKDNIVTKKKRRKTKGLTLRFDEDTSPKKHRRDEDNSERSDIEIITKNTENKDIINVTVDTEENPAKRHKKLKKRNKDKILRKNIRVKIKLKRGGVKLQITSKEERKNKQSKERKYKKRDKEGKPKQSSKKLKQFILKYPSEVSSSILSKPEVDVTPKKRSYVKSERSPDNLVQTSIQSFFKLKPS